MLRVRDDVPGAFAELVDQFWPRVYGRFYRMFGDRQEAEDLAQDVFLRVYRNRHRYQPRAQFATWLFHIARNVARNAVRRRYRRPVVSMGQLAFLDHDESMEAQIADDPSDSPSRRLDRAETAQVIREAVSRLAYRSRTAIELQFQDRTYSEIADVLDMTPKAAKSLLYRTRLQLRDVLGPLVGKDV
jgi:RNA polymerase sigma-70 factor (ECF subfamily)